MELYLFTSSKYTAIYRPLLVTGSTAGLNMPSFMLITYMSSAQDLPLIYIIRPKIIASFSYGRNQIYQGKCNYHAQSDSKWRKNMDF